MSHSPLKTVVIIVSMIVFLLCETRFSSEALTDEQRKEIENLRSELEEALEKDEERTMKEHGVIIQPGWTQNQKSSHKMETKVVVNSQSLNEAKFLRDEINKAIQQDSYSPLVGRGHIGANTHIIQELHKKYVANENNQKTSKVTMLATENSNLTATMPNVIEISSANLEPEIDIRKLQRLELNKRRTKESLILEFIEEDFSFTFGEHVQEWEHILHGGQEYLIGRLEQDLQIVQKNNLQYEAGKLLHIGAPVTYLETYSFWNADRQQQEGVILVATGNKVLWYRSDEVGSEIKLYWEWVVGNTITGLTYFTADAQDYLVISSNQSSLAGHYALNIYQFDLKTKEFWIAQRMQLAHPCGEVSFLNTGRDFILAIPQNNTAIIYTFNQQTEASGHLRFQPKFTFESEGIEYITAFQMGGHSYLALGGLQPKILLYQQGKFIPKTIFGNNFGLVEFFFPIPVRTYRDDLILLVQHRVDFSTHKLAVLETLIWDGEAFEATIPAPCKLGSHTVYGVGCMLDIQRDVGIKGAALLKRGDEISVIVPRHEAESGLFRLHTKLLTKNSELIDLQEIFEFLKNWVAEQDKLIAQAQAFVEQPSFFDQAPNLPNLSNLQLLKTPELYFTGSIKQLFINNYKWTQQDSLTDLNFVLDEIEQLGQEFEVSQRHRRDAADIEKSVGHNAEFANLELDDVLAEFLEFENLNGKPFYVKDAEIDFEGILNLVNLEVLEMEKVSQNMAVSGELTLNQDLEFEEINGIPWSDIAENLVFRNKPMSLQNMEIEGEIIVEGPLNISKLNSLQFPNDFLWSEGVYNQIIEAPKNFTKTLAANHVDTEGLINNMDPLDIVTLSDPQYWTGSPTFAHLEVSEIFELNGTASGRGVEEFPNNPTLVESHTVNANCEFVNLRVLGEIKIEENFNSKPLGHLLTDIVQRPLDLNAKIHIPSKKKFSEIYFPIDFNVLDGTINNITIDDFIPKHTTQDLKITKLFGNSYFNNLTLNGTFDGVDINELINNTIKTNTPQFLPKTQLNFGGMVNANAINIVNTLNGVSTATAFQTTEEDLKLPAAYFETLKVDEANIFNQTKGAAKLNGLALSNLMEDDNEAEPILNAGNIFVDELILENNLNVDEIQGINAEYLYNFLNAVDNLPDMILDGKVHVDHINVTGDVQVHSLNEQNFDEDIQMTAIWLNRPNYLSTTLQFIEPVDLQADLVVLGDYNDNNLPDLIDDMIFRNPNGTVLVLAPKKFVEAVNVLENTKIDGINGIPFKEIATKRTIGHFSGDLQINGNLHVQDLSVNGSLNDFFMSNISNQIYFDENLRAFVLPGVTRLTSFMELEDLTVWGDLNKFESLRKFFKSLVYKQNINLLQGQYNFTGRVTIERGVYIKNLNSHNLLDLFENVVFINGLESTVIDSEINFTAPIKGIILNIQKALITHSITGCDLSKWINDTLRLDKPEIITNSLRFEPNSLHGNSLYASYLNNIDMSKIITVHTPQNLTGELNFSEIYLNGEILAMSSVNGADIQLEYENTVFTQGDQHIKTPLKIQNVNVLEDVITKAPINSDKDLNDAVILHEDVEFESPFFFQKLKVQNLKTDDLISGINFDDWQQQALWLEGRQEQKITGNWSVRAFSIKNGPSLPAELLGSTRKVRDSNEGFSELCQQLQKLWLKQNKNSYFVRHLSKAFEIDLNQKLEHQIVRRVFFIKTEKKIYLLVGIGCETMIFTWQANENSFKVVGTYETGQLKQAFVAFDPKILDGSIKLMTNSINDENQNCSLTGLNIWHIKDYQLVHTKSFDENITQIWNFEREDAIFAITNQGLKQISINEPYQFKILQLDYPLKLVEYSFFNYGDNFEIYFTNQTHIIQINATNSTQLTRQQRSLPERYSFITNYPRVVHTLNKPDESILKPNTTLIRKLTFADFSQVIERILEDLDYRLSIEVNITQLSIPETDLYDAHLIEDFMAIMEELRSQDIYPPNTFTDINLSNLKIPENPAQVLAARTVQIVWPVIVEINEVHRYLQGTSSNEHPVSGCILKHLGFTIHEILILAYTDTKEEEDETFDYSETLSAVIQRIRLFQEDLMNLKTELQIEIEEDLTAEIDDEIKINEEQIFINTTADEITVGNTASFSEHELLQNFSLKVLEKSILSNNENREILKLEVATASKPRMLLAVSSSNTQLTPGQPAGIHLYTDLLQSQIFQFIPTHRARYLTTIRIRDITFLAYVEHCCLIHVLQYRGVEGFVNFAKISTDITIQQLASVSLSKTDSKIGHYFVAVFKHKLVFYEVLIAGLRDNSIAYLKNCT